MDKNARKLKLCVQLLKSIRDNYDCDEDAHRYNTPCRCCDARALIDRVTKRSTKKVKGAHNFKTRT